MGAINLNQSPREELDDDPLDDDDPPEPRLLLEPRSCDAGASRRWWAEAFSLFRRSPAMWVGLMLIYFILLLVLSNIPLLYLALYVIGPIFVGGIMIGCATLDRGEELEFFHLFLGFHRHGPQLLLVGVGFIVILLLSCIALTVPAYFIGVREGPLLPLIVLLALSASAVPVWFAPVLIVQHGLNVAEAMRLSALAFRRNIVPALGLVLIALLMLLPVIFLIAVLTRLATLPDMLIQYWFYLMLVGVILALPTCVWFALLLITQYTSYKEIFVEAAESAPAPAELEL